MAIYGIHTMARYVVINNAMREEGGRHAAVEAEGHHGGGRGSVAGAQICSGVIHVITSSRHVREKVLHFF